MGRVQPSKSPRRVPTIAPPTEQARSHLWAYKLVRYLFLSYIRVFTRRPALALGYKGSQGAPLEHWLPVF